MDSIVHGVAKSRTRLSDFHFDGEARHGPLNGWMGVCYFLSHHSPLRCEHANIPEKPGGARISALASSQSLDPAPPEPLGAPGGPGSGLEGPLLARGPHPRAAMGSGGVEEIRLLLSSPQTAP